MILHHLQNSRSQRIVWLFEELNLEYEIKFYTLESAKDSGMKFPTVDIIEAQQSLTETSAIIEMICDGQEKFKVGHGDQSFWTFCFYKNFSEASLMPNIALKQIFQQIKIQTPFPFRPITFAIQKAFNHGYLNPELNKQLEQIDQHLGKYSWIAGDVFTYADILIWFPLEAAQYAVPDFIRHEHIIRYLDCIKERSAYKSALSRGQWSSELFNKYWKVTL